VTGEEAAGPRIDALRWCCAAGLPMGARQAGQRCSCQLCGMCSCCSERDRVCWLSLPPMAAGLGQCWSPKLVSPAASQAQAGGGGGPARAT